MQSLFSDTLSPWHRQHLLDLDDFARAEIEAVLLTSDAMMEVLSRDIPRVPALRGVTVASLFYEPSTRTRVSFELAAKALGGDFVGVSANNASAEKGESLIDTVQTLQKIGAQLVVLRHPKSGAPYLVASHASCGVINAGDGFHAHPSQALLDIYTMRSHFGDISGRRIVIVGDVGHSRVARSNIWGLSTLGASVTICAPATLLPSGIYPRRVVPEGAPALPQVDATTNLEGAIEDADIVMVLRLQRERQMSHLIPSLREYVRRYQVNEERMARAKSGALVMHPGPVNEGIEISPALARSSRSLIGEQVRSGVAVRMALLYLMARGNS